MINIPGFTIDKEVGHGGMATVYLGVQDLLKRDVALKIMLPEMARDKKFRNSFMSEGAIIASLDHPNIVRIHDIGIVDETILYMAMEYLSGNTLKEKLSKGILPFPEAFRILKQVASGLSYAHDKGYIHRDIKPGNILFRENGTAVITDFGIAKLQDTSGELTQMGYTMGTIQYMSPEQVVTTDLDKRSDIYSLGLIFYEMLTGLKAFKAETAIQAIHQHTTLPPPTLEGEYAYLQAAIDKVLAKEPENRFQNATDFVKAVSEAEPLDETVIHRIQDDADKTVIHRIQDDADKTQIFIPGQVEEISTKVQQQDQVSAEKKKSKLLPFGLVGVAIAGLAVFGILKFTNTDKPKEEPKLITNLANEVRVKPEDIIKPVDSSTETLEVAPVKEVIAITSKPALISKPVLESSSKPITTIYQPKKYNVEIEAELDELVKYAKEILVAAPDNNKAKQVLNDVLSRYHLLAHDLVKSMDIDKAKSLVEKGLKVSSSYSPLVEMAASLDRENRTMSEAQLITIRELSEQANIHMQEGRYVLPKGKNALEDYQKVLTIDPHNLIASKEINSLLFVFENKIKNNLKDNKYQANEFLNQALAIAPYNERLIKLQNTIKTSQKLN